MKIELDNDTTEDVMPYLALAAKVVSVPKRTIRVKVKYTRRDTWRWYSGYAKYNGEVSIRLPRDGNGKFPFERTTLGYFRSHEIPLHKPYRVDNWHELLTGVAAHEFAHYMPRGRNHRKSRIELFCELKKAEALELLRSEEGQKFVKDYHKPAIARYQRRAARVRTLREYKDSREGKLANLRARQKRWITRIKRATTALKKINRSIARLEKAGQQVTVTPS